MRRINTHCVETKACDYIRNLIDSYYENGDALYRELSGRDYGIDAIIELFEGGVPTGKIAYVQVKGTQKTIVPMKTSPYVSCKISASNVFYSFQNRIPVIIILVCVSKEHCFYYGRLQDLITDEHISKVEKQKELSIRLPVINSSYDGLERLFDLIRSYY